MQWSDRCTHMPRSARADERTRPPTLPARLRLWSESRTDNATLLGSRDSSQEISSEFVDEPLA
jgi:hypothetical protein